MITIGHILVFLILGAVIFFGLSSSIYKGELAEMWSKWKSQAQELIETYTLGRDEEEKKPPAEAINPTQEVVTAPSPVAEAAPVPQQVPATAPPLRTEPVPGVQPAPGPKEMKRVRTSQKRKQVRRGPRKKAPAAKAKSADDKLIGTYVALELATGREVKGILEEKTATHYKVELPGVGSFIYPLENVKSVKPAE